MSITILFCFTGTILVIVLHCSCRDFLPVISSLRHNNFFEGIIDRDGKLGPTMIEELSQVLNSSPSIKTLVLSNCGLKPYVYLLPFSLSSLHVTIFQGECDTL